MAKDKKKTTAKKIVEHLSSSRAPKREATKPAPKTKEKPEDSKGEDDDEEE